MGWSTKVFLVIAVVLMGVHSFGQAKFPAGGEKVDLPPGVSGDWWGTVQQNIRKEEYNISSMSTGSGARFQAPNRAHGFRSRFSEKGVQLIPRTEGDPAWEWGLELVQKTEGGRLKAEVTATGNRIEIGRGNITEWYVNDENGLEQGFTVLKPIEESGKLHIDMKLTGTLRPKFSVDGQAVDFYGSGSLSVLTYSKLKVTDASGRLLVARFEGINGGIRITVDDKEASYPVTVDPLATTPSWTAEGNQAAAYFGTSVSTAGDVNGDGYSDVIVGSYGYDNGQTDEGAAFLYYGTASGLNATKLVLESEQASAYFGSSVSTAGDINGDGYSDIVVGAYYYDDGQSNEGAAFVYYGSASGLNTTPLVLECNQDNARFGWSVGTAGDVNGDGYSDVIVGANYYVNGQTNEGGAFLYYGSASGLNTTPLILEGDQTAAFFGWSVGTAGDMNGDGYGDVIVGSFQYKNGQTNEGAVLLYYGSAAGLNTTRIILDSNQDLAYLGESVSTAGDINGDGYSDIVAGARYYDNGQTDEGAAFVYYGSASGVNTTPLILEADQAGANFGSSVAAAGDVNGDGYGDIVVGAFYYDNSQTNEGAVFFYYGSASGVNTTPVILESNQAEAYFGCSASTAGDVNGDGYSDIIVGAYYYDNGQSDEGAAFVYHGSASGLGVTPVVLEADQADARFGSSVATAGDVNGDGYSDIIVGAYYHDNGETNEGAAFLYYGSASGLNTTPVILESNQAYSYFGYSVATAGDVNGDGYSDIIVGAYYYDNGQSDEGAAFVYYGSASGLNSTPLILEADQAMAYFGNSVAPAGDLNGDGYSDIIVGAYFYNNGQPMEGAAFVYYGSASGLNTTPLVLESNQTLAYLGFSVGSAGDVNEDGYGDIVVGAYRYHNGQSNEGAAFLYYGSAFGLNTTPLILEYNQANAQFGYSVATGGDVNGDGYSDIVIGSPYYDNGQTNEGAAFFYYGSASGLNTTPLILESNQGYANLGESVSTAGDLNGDGYSDIVVGADGYHNSLESEGAAFVYYGSASGLNITPLILEANQAYAHFGWSVATAGDVNGDGYSDIIVGAYYYDNGQSDEGAAFVYYGNGGPCLSLAPQQRRTDDSAPVEHLGLSDESDMFEIGLLGRSVYGRGEFKLKWEVKPFGTLLDGTGTGQTATWQDTGVTGLYQKEIVGGLTPGTLYHWRVRALYNPSNTPFQQAGPWISMPSFGWQEADLRTAADADLAVSQTDSPDPVMIGGGNVTYTLTISNAGPDPALTFLTDTLPAGMTLVSVTPSQGSYSESGGVVRCELGTVASGGSATVQIVMTPVTAGTWTNHAHVFSAARDSNPADNTSDETTTVNTNVIGDLIWLDSDGNGIQDAGEPGMEGIIVKLYNSSYMWVNETVTDSSGRYQFAGLPYGSSYFIKVILPSVNYSFSQPNQGSDDTLDSDVNTTTGQTPVFTLVNGVDPSSWDAGMVYGISCEAPDEPVWIYLVTLSDPDDYPILNFQDPNQPTQRTGYNVRRSDDPSVVPKSSWPVVCSNCVDMDAATPNYQWTDTSGDIPGSGVWYYLVTAYNAYCPAEGPFSSE